MPTELSPNPRRVQAGRRNRALRKGLTDAGREALRLAALHHQPWQFSTGPKSEAGKRIVAQNGKRRQLGPKSVREIRLGLADISEFIVSMRKMRDLAE